MYAVYVVCFSGFQSSRKATFALYAKSSGSIFLMFVIGLSNELNCLLSVVKEALEEG